MSEQTSSISKYVLIVEDDFDIRNSLRQILELEGYKVLSAENGLEGLRLLQNLKSPCLVLLDMMMPVMDGFEFLRAKGADITVAPMPVVVVSANADPAKISDAKAYVKKPIDIDVLLRVVAEYCK